MGNLRKKVKIRLVNNAEDYKKYVNEPSFVSQKIFNKNFVAIHEIKPVLIIDKPIYVRCSILDLSKFLMYVFHYKYIKTEYDNRVKLLFTDRDSLIFEIETNDVYEDFYKNKNLFDFSDYPKDSQFFDHANKKVIGKMKDKLKGKISGEFVGLNSKMYSLVIEGSEEIKKAKDLNRNVVENTRHKEYVDVLFNKYFIRHKMKKIQSKLSRIGTFVVCKIYLSCFDDKRYILNDGINSLAYFHKDVKS